MRNSTNKEQLDSLIKQSLNLRETPSQDLNLQLKKALYEQEHNNISKLTEHTVSFWYLPMILNFIVFAVAAIFFIVTVTNPYLLTVFLLMCAHASVAGLLLTLLGLRRASLKQEMSMHLKKRGIEHD